MTKHFYRLIVRAGLAIGIAAFNAGTAQAAGVKATHRLGPVDQALQRMTPERMASLMLQKDHRAGADVIDHAWRRVRGLPAPNWRDCQVEKALREVMLRERLTAPLP